MLTVDKLFLLTSGAAFDICGAEGTRKPDPSPFRFLYKAALPQGNSVCLFKVLQTNACTNDCAYCSNQVGRDCPRFTFRPEELARTFMELYRKRIARGLFLSSAVNANPSRTMERMINTVEILRHRYEYKGYIHLKIMPGASFDCVEEACKLADRVSVNMEAPTKEHLSKLSSCKDLFHGIIERMKWVKQLTDHNGSLAPSGQTTQFVVGAAGETDRELIDTTQALYKEVGLRRAYFSAFKPISYSRLENRRPTPPIREHRLYQVDWLMRVYGFPVHEILLALDKDEFLPLRKDPKLIIASKEPWLFPVDINRASYDELLRVPGIGPVSANRIIETRKDHSINSLEQLIKMHVVVKRANHFIWFRSMLSSEKQLSFLPQMDEEEREPEPTLSSACR
ncbi:MAG: helix-hairpin-helix domain-containing protein [Dehalococcoidales bacterium]|nr:helix-hairpin-helix domain-containing protein [Dehalococcoidales bacterium]